MKSKENSMICTKCAWSKVEEEFPFCIDFRKCHPDADDCDRFFPFDWGVEEDKECECGADKCGSPKHSSWCAKNKKIEV
jgi:hypothetical protein